MLFSKSKLFLATSLLALSCSSSLSAMEDENKKASRLISKTDEQKEEKTPPKKVTYFKENGKLPTLPELMKTFQESEKVLSLCTLSYTHLTTHPKLVKNNITIQTVSFEDDEFESVQKLSVTNWIDSKKSFSMEFLSKERGNEQAVWDNLHPFKEIYFENKEFYDTLTDKLNRQVTSFTKEEESFINIYTLCCDGSNGEYIIKKPFSFNISSFSEVLPNYYVKFGKNWEAEKEVDTFFPFLQRLKNLTDLSFSAVGLEYISPRIGCLSNLKVLDLSNNHLTKLPPEVGNLVSLEELNVTHNGLTTLPKELQSISNLKSLDISFNSLYPAPLIVAELKALEKLILDGNPFYNMEQPSSVPDKIRKLPNLKEKDFE